MPPRERLFGRRGEVARVLLGEQGQVRPLRGVVGADQARPRRHRRGARQALRWTTEALKGLEEDRREMIAMTSARALALAIALGTASAVAAHAQMAPWPDAPRPQPQAAPWPGSPQPAPPQAGWPGSPQPAPQQGGWPASPQPAMGAPSGSPMQGAGPTPEQADCMREFQQYRQEVEKRGLAAKSAGESHKASREE